MIASHKKGVHLNQMDSLQDSVYEFLRSQNLYTQLLSY